MFCLRGRPTKIRTHRPQPQGREWLGGWGGGEGGVGGVEVGVGVGCGRGGGCGVGSGGVMVQILRFCFSDS